MSLPESAAPRPALAPKDYKRDLKPVWCPGCGDFGVVNALYKTLSDLGLERHNTALVSGIGCSSRLPGYVAAYGFNALHGRALTLATGTKLANSKVTTIVAGGDGDGFAIGMGHFPHAARRNLDMTYILMDNRIYGLTKGQLSPTSEPDIITKTSTMGNIERPIDPVAMALATGVTFIARTVSTNIKHMTEMFTRAIRHSGFSFVQVLSPCVTFRGKTQYKDYQGDGVTYLDQVGHNHEDFQSALAVANSGDAYQLGIIWHVHTESFGLRYARLREAFKQDKSPELLDVVNDFLP
ncbi:MAG: 2-oxoacid:ferredoxin oxidoreductase subunit beta [bacterium]|nr:2-oxoacid:ferredoxin oxidoreductase subunit beta [bacterium]